MNNQIAKQSKNCWDCKEELPLSAFNKDTSRCTKCKIHYSKKYNAVDFLCACGVTCKQNNKSRHLKSKTHQLMVAEQK